MKIRLYLLAIAALSLCLLLVTPPTAWAHVVASDGTIGAELHIEPDDDPVAGRPNHIEFEIQDKANKFQFGSCYCVLHVSRDGKLISANLMKDSAVAYTFPTTGNYRMMLNGRSVDGSFSAFSLPYDVQVTKTVTTSGVAGGLNPLLRSIIFAGYSLLMTAAIVLYARNKPGSPTGRGQSAKPGVKKA